jgi:metal-responsive CopG/Arc/MetJ family transcriptional regulator
MVDRLNLSIDDKGTILILLSERRCPNMDAVKTAISLKKSLFHQAEDLARKMKVSRSRLFVLALEDYIRREENRELLEKINSAYAGEPDAAEQKLRSKVGRHHRRMVEGEW